MGRLIEREVLREQPLRPTARRLLLALVSLGLLVDLVLQLLGPGVRDGLDLYLFETLVGVVLALFAWRPTAGAVGLLVLLPIGQLVADPAFLRLALPCAFGLVVATCARAVVAGFAATTLIWVCAAASAGSVLVAGLAFTVVAGAASGTLGWAYRRAGVREASLTRAAERHEEEVAQARLVEQHRIADEIHDGIARQLTLIAIQVKVLERTTDPEVRTVSERAIADSAAGALEDLRRALRLDDGAEPESSRTRDSWEPALDDVVHGLRAEGRDVDVDVDVAPHVAGPAVVESTLARVLRESAHNIHVHAPSTSRVAIRLSDDDGLVRLDVVNAPPRASVAREGRPPGGYGLVRLAEVARVLGGSFTAEETPDGGWCVTARLPRT